MTRITGPDCAVMCNLINTYTQTHTHTHARTGTFIPHASSSMQTEGSACRHPTAPYRTEEVTGSEGREGANVVGGGIGVGGGKGDGHGVGSGNGDGDGAGAGTGLEANEGA